MAVPNSRATFKEYVLRSLGKPVIEINVSDEQVEDRIDQALKYYSDYHFDASEVMYYKYQLTPTDITNKYITIPENIIGVVDIFDLGSVIQSGNMFNVRYQFALSEMHRLASSSLVPYYMARQHIELFEQILVGKQPFRYSRHRNRLEIDMDWSIVTADQFLVAKCYRVIDPTEYTNVWGDRWLFLYTKQLVKQQWGEQLHKYPDMVLPGGVRINGQKIYEEATAEIEKMERDMIMNFSPILSDLVG